MTVARDIMQARVLTVGPEMTVNEAGRLLERARIGGAPVVDGRRRLLGVLSRSDLLRRHQAAPAEIPAFYREGEGVTLARPVESPGEARVAEVMTPVVLSAEESTPMRALARFMVTKRIHRVVIVKDGALRGIVTTMDVLRLVAEGPRRGRGVRRSRRRRPASRGTRGRRPAGAKS
jgi:CBS domain-containing protein